MKIGLIYDINSSAPPPHHPHPEDDDAELSSPEEIQGLIQTLESIGHSVTPIGDLRQLVRFINSRHKVDLFFNYAVGRVGSTREAQIPSLLEALQLPHTGTDSFTLSLCIDKVIVKRLWQAAALPTPEYAVIKHMKEIDQTHFPDFPLFLKPSREGSSKGVSNHSLVHSMDELRAQAAFLLTTYAQPVLVEAFITGREFYLGCVQSGEMARPLGYVEIAQAPHAFADYATKKKWDENVFLPVESDELKTRLVDIGLKAYQAVDCRVIGRVDMRMDDAGQLYLLEINPNPSLEEKHSSMAALASFSGITFSNLIKIVINMAEEKWYPDR